MGKANNREAIAPVGFIKLEFDWVGDIVNSDGKTSKLRLEYGMIRGEEVMLARLYDKNSYSSSDGPLYIPKLPARKELESIKTVSELTNHFGQSRRFTDGWGALDRMHWSVGWTYITKESPTRLRYLSVFGHVSQADGAKPGSPIDVDKLRISEGILRPADPNSQAELQEYPTGETLFLAREKEKEEKRKVYPMPLRKLVEADEHPDDSELKHYRKYLNQIRKNPDPELFRQLISVMDEGTMARKSDLEAIIFDSVHELDPWTVDNWNLAIKTCVASIPLAKNLAQDDLIGILLRANGGGVIKNNGQRIEVKKLKNGWRYNQFHATVKVPIAVIQRQLLEMLIKKTTVAGDSPVP